MKKRAITVAALILICVLILFSGCTAAKQPPLEDAQPSRTSSIGFIGCSNTRQTLQGYQFVDGQQLWEVKERNIHEYDGGAVVNWAKTSEKKYEELWKVFDNYLQQNPNTKSIWWQLCIRKEEAGMTYDDASYVLAALRQRIPGVTIYVSALPDFPEHICEITGTEGIQQAKELVEELDNKNEDVITGPIIGPLFPSDIDKEDESRCHPHVESAMKTGRQLKEFFESLNFSVDSTFQRESDSLNDKKDLENKDKTIAERHWERVFSKAFADIDCPAPRDPNSLPEGYYKGKMIDTHIHLQSLPDGEPGHPDEDYAGENLGIKKSINEWICMMNVEGTKQAWGFFPVWEPIVQESVDVVTMIMEKYPNRFIPFINTPAHDGNPTVIAEELEEMLQVEPRLFQGYGEIGLYSHDNVADLPPDSPRFTEIFPIIRKHNLVVYFHPGFGHKEPLERAASANRDIRFVFHGGNLYVISENQVGISHDEKILSDIEELLNNNPNIYYGVDELYGGDWLLEPGRSKENFLANFADYDILLEKDLSLWKGFIERHPNQVIWGTDRGVSATWDKDPDVALTLNNYTRAFIGKLDQAVQEKFAYKNAERLFSE